MKNDILFYGSVVGLISLCALFPGLATGFIQSPAGRTILMTLLFAASVHKRDYALVSFFAFMALWYISSQIHKPHQYKPNPKDLNKAFDPNEVDIQIAKNGPPAYRWPTVAQPKNLVPQLI